MKINIIVAADKNNVIGVDGKLPWHLPEDLKRFKALTLGHAVIMGRGTFESLGSKPLPGRMNFVLSRSLPEKWLSDELAFMRSLSETLDVCQQAGFEQVFVIGGQSIYELAMPMVERIYLTRVNQLIFNESVRFFPAINKGHFKEVACSAIDSCEFIEYERYAGLQ